MRRLLVFAGLFVSILCAHAEYKLVWSDEFDSIDSDVWNNDLGWGNYGWGNNEQEFYTSNSENIFVNDSKLHIVALRSDAHKNVSDRIKYTSAKIHTRRNVSVKYGRIEARIKMPERGQGVWPAFWMLGEDQEKGWPYCGEIDICEWRGAKPAETVSTMHWNGTNAEYMHCEYGQTLKYSRGFDEDFFVYCVEWTPKKAEFYIIDEKDDSRHDVNVMDISSATVENGLSCFHQAQYIILNLAMGGMFGGDVDETIDSRTMQVDWIRVYQDMEAFPESRFYNNSDNEPFAYGSDCNLLKGEPSELNSFFAPNWEEKSVSVSGDAEKLELSLPSPTYERWQAQFSLFFPDVNIKKDVQYDMSFSLESDAALSKVLVKVYDGKDDIAYIPSADFQNYDFAAGKKKDIVLTGMVAPKDMDGVKILFDFGNNPAATVRVSDIVLKEKDCDPTSVVDVTDDIFDVYCEDGEIVISVEEKKVVYVYSVDGKCIKLVDLQEGKNIISVKAGIYIVKIGNKEVKCILL